MKIAEILKHECTGNYQGYLPASISHSNFTHKDLGMYRKLKRIPAKISYFFHRDKIESVYKSDCFSNPLDEYYLILSKDNTIFDISY